MNFNIHVQKCYYNEKFKECVLTRKHCFKLGAVCEYCEVAASHLHSESTPIKTNRECYATVKVESLTGTTCHVNGTTCHMLDELGIKWCDGCTVANDAEIKYREQLEHINEAKIKAERLTNEQVTEANKTPIPIKRKISILQRIIMRIFGWLYGNLIYWKAERISYMWLAYSGTKTVSILITFRFDSDAVSKSLSKPLRSCMIFS